MKFILYTLLFTELALLSPAFAAEHTNQWFAGMRTPPKVLPALPSNFIVVSASPEAKSTKVFSMYDGNIWAPEKTARQFEYGAEKMVGKAKEPMFYVRLSSDVGQIQNENTFTNEKNIEANYSKAGLKKVRSTKSQWGEYPVISLTGERPDGSPVFIAWVGINSREGWTVIIDYRVPKGKGHPTKEERQIWRNFLHDTKPAK